MKLPHDPTIPLLDIYTNEILIKIYSTDSMSRNPERTIPLPQWEINQNCLRIGAVFSALFFVSLVFAVSINQKTTSSLFSIYVSGPNEKVPDLFQVVYFINVLCHNTDIVHESFSMWHLPLFIQHFIVITMLLHIFESLTSYFTFISASIVAQIVKNQPAILETWMQSL